MGTRDYIDMGEAAKLLKTGRTRLFRRLRDANILDSKNIPYQKYMKYFKVVRVQIMNGKETRAKTLISARGIEFITKLFARVGLVTDGALSELIQITDRATN